MFIYLFIIHVCLFIKFIHVYISYENMIIVFQRTFPILQNCAERLEEFSQAQFIVEQVFREN